MPQPTSALVLHRFRHSIIRFRDDESGAMAFFFILIFVLMITFGGIAVDVMRFETRRVAMQQTLDRASLAAASLTQTRTPQQVVDDYFAKANLGEGLSMVDFAAPTVTSSFAAGLRGVSVSAGVTSKNFFMGIFSPLDTLEHPSTATAEQGVEQIEVMLVLDITGSMTGLAGGGKSRLEALKEAVSDFVTIVKAKDKVNGVSIGVVPYADQVNVPAVLRQQFNVSNLSSWNGVPDVGVPNINCLEFPTSGFNTTGVSLTTPIPMAAVADAVSTTIWDGTYVAPQEPYVPPPASIFASGLVCNTTPDIPATAWDDTTVNQVLLPTKNGDTVKTKASRLVADGNTNIAVGMRWGTALLDEAARPVYTKLLGGEPGMAGRPVDNNDVNTRKIIILMTDGQHVSKAHIHNPDFKSGLSPIWRGGDGRFAIMFADPAIRPGSDTAAASCSGWQFADHVDRQYFVPHLKRNTVNQRVGSESEGNGLGTSVANACDPQAWLATPSWSGSGTVVRLDWSEVWRYVRASWVAQQLYVRSGVTGFTDYATVFSSMSQTYLTSNSNMDALLQTNCAAARAADMEVYGIAFAAGPGGRTQIHGCASEPKDNYYFSPTSGDDIKAVFRKIAAQLHDLRLTQ